MTGTPNQVELATLIKSKVADDFDRVATVLRKAAERQSEDFRTETLALIAILEEKRAEVLMNVRAGDFIRDWQEMSGKVGPMLAGDPRYQTIRTARHKRVGLANE
jgi:hypothetical protein